MDNLMVMRLETMLPKSLEVEYNDKLNEAAKREESRPWEAAHQVMHPVLPHEY